MTLWRDQDEPKTRWERFKDWLSDSDWGVPGIVIGIAVVIIAGMCWYAAHEQALDDAAPQFTLSKREWFCSASHVQTVLIPIMAGKVTTFVPSTTTICTQYNRLPQ